MARKEQTVYLTRAKSYLPQLIAECARDDSKVSDTSGNGPEVRPVSGSITNSSIPSVWKGVKSKKKSTNVQVWEKESVQGLGPEFNTATLVNRTDHSNNNYANNDPWTTTASTFTAGVLPLGTHHVAHMYAVRSSVTVPAPLDVVLKVLDCSAVSAYRSFTKIIYESLIGETSVLFHSHSASSSSSSGSSSASSLYAPSESLAARWLTCRCNNPMVSDCDFCLLDAYKILYSIETKSCPELFDMHRIARCNVPLGGFLFYPTENSEVTDVVFYMAVTQDRMAMSAATSATTNSAPIQNNSSNNPFSAASSNDRQFRAVQKVLQHMARGIGRIRNAVDAYSMSLRLEILRDNSRWVRNTDRAECVVCYRRFHQLTRRRHHCRMCGDVICRDCSVYKDADLPNVGPTLVRICKLCELNELKHVSINSDSVVPSATTTAEPTTTATTAADAAPRPLARKRSATINVDTSKAIVHEHEQQPDVGRRFTTVVDGKQRRELSEHAFNTPKADIMDRKHKWNTGGGGKPLAILSPSFATHRPGKAAFAPKSMTPKARSHAPQVWDLDSAAIAAASREIGEASSSSSSSSSAAAQPPMSKLSKKQPHAQANSCSKLASKNDRFTFTFRRKKSRQEENNYDDEEEEKSAVVVPTSALPGRPSRAIKSGKMVSPMHDGLISSNGRQRAVSIKNKRNNQQQNDDGEIGGVAAHKLMPRKLPNVHQYEDILLTLCEQVSNLLNCKYAAVSIFTAPPSARVPTRAQQPVGGIASPASHENYTMVHFLKAEGSKKLGKVSANMKCCAPMLELKDKIIVRDTLAECNLFDFKKLPIVMGPQQVRFYAGIPLVDPMTHQMVGAFAVFNSNVYRRSNLNEVLPTLETFAAVALDAIEDRKTDLELQSFLQNPLVDAKTLDNQSALRLSEPVLQVDKFLSENGDGAIEYDREKGSDDGRFRTTGHMELAVRPRFSTRPPSVKKRPEHGTIEFYKRQMEKLVRQARDTEAQVLENSMAMKRHGVVI
uniref:FYVE-type domain-containing protein n=1 Tax=Globisporangium ultimum (strain ATCC 200006 / CBS 805.95 / DAOM BR144) TaxID=431595 RepID=K3WUJ3_GLOUD